MAAKKIRDLAVKTGEYQDRDSGDTKGRYQNVGALMKNDDGSEFILLARWFNPAGIPSDRETIIVSCFKLRDQQEQGGNTQGGARQNTTRTNNQRQQQPAGGADDGDIPF